MYENEKSSIFIKKLKIEKCYICCKNTWNFDQNWIDLSTVMVNGD